ncbi:MAG: DinB family protein [Winogradskyella sp.]|nr:DinB family protein [Winogradskyella sp.]
MLTSTLIKLFSRDLEKLKQEIEAYKEEEKLWIVTKEISNSTGNLCLHIIGNLNHFIGAVLGNTGYIRQRDLEFSLKDIPVKKMVRQIDDTINVVQNTLSKLTERDLQEEYKRNPFEYYMTTEYFLVHLSMHLAYHLGQINYHRRLLIT